MKIIAPAGSNVAYIGMIITNTPLEPAQTYHIQEKNLPTARFLYSHDTKDTDRDVKISFDKMPEIIVLNWQVKFRMQPQSEGDKSQGDAWAKEQQKCWQSYGQDWEARSVLHWTHKICNDKSLLSDYDNVGLMFRGESLYEGYESACTEFKKLNVEYTQIEYDTWRESQKHIFKFLESIRQVSTLAQIKQMDNNVIKGIALGIYAKKNAINDEDVWQLYIK